MCDAQHPMSYANGLHRWSCTHPERRTTILEPPLRLLYLVHYAYGWSLHGVNICRNSISAVEPHDDTRLTRVSRRRLHKRLEGPHGDGISV